MLFSSLAKDQDIIKIHNDKLPNVGSQHVVITN
jgi:hypothetical protein